MSNNNNDRWRTLRLSHNAPRLMVKTRFDDDGYSIALTDLSRIWSETLTRDVIIRRANDEKCSIDANENDQYKILLDKIRSAFDGSPDSTLSLVPSDNGAEISVNVSAELPGSLPTFYWYPELRRLPDSALASQLVTPLVLRADHLQNNIQQLVDEVAARDRVIAKITDRLATSGHDLTNVFPGVSNVKTSRKRSQREQLASHSKGLADFDEISWRATVFEQQEAQQLSGPMLDAIFKELPEAESATEQSDDVWWRNHSTLYAEKSPHGPANGRPQVEKILSPSRSISSVMNKEDQSLERQSTFPQSVRRTATPSTVDEAASKHRANLNALSTTKNSARIDDSTEEDNDLDAVPSRPLQKINGSSRSDQQPSIGAASKGPLSGKLGIMGGKKNAPLLEESSPAPSSPRQASKESRLGTFGAEAKSTTPDPEPARQHDSSEETKNTSPPKLKSESSTSDDYGEVIALSSPAKSTNKLGKFGGKKNTGSVEATTNRVQASPRRKLGMMGGRGAREEAAAQISSIATSQVREERPSRAPERQDEIEQERGNSEERADRKRERLKRELEKKAKAPVKKKRKF